jgi:hypothetical protein
MALCIMPTLVFLLSGFTNQVDDEQHHPCYPTPVFGNTAEHASIPRRCQWLQDVPSAVYWLIMVSLSRTSYPSTSLQVSWYCRGVGQQEKENHEG